ncbi:trimeric LpxA-like protein [Hyaloraphidium curvatum]|nr:trimeric LpxA-like protein [Hyaloraphidium curvatum]
MEPAPPAPAVLFRCGGGQAGVLWEAVAPRYATAARDGNAACWDDGPGIHPALTAAGFVHLRSENEALEFASRHPQLDVFVSHGTPASRKRLAARLRSLLPGIRFPPAMHPLLCPAMNCTFGEGTFVAPFARIGPNASVGAFCHVGPFTIISHDCRVGDYVQLNGHNSIGGGTRLEEGVHLGLNAHVGDHVGVAPWTVIGLNSGVLRSITEGGVTWIGTPARPMERKGREAGGKGDRAIERL